MSKVLIADDDDAIGTLLSALLTEEGYQVTRAQNGAEALEVLQREGGWVILLDLMMPTIDGYEALRQLQQHPTLLDGNKVIVMSASWRLRAAKKAIQKVVDEEFHLSRQSRQGRVNAARYNRKGIQPAPSVGLVGIPTSQTPVANADSLASNLLGKPQVVVIGPPPIGPSEPGGATKRGKRQQPASTAAKKPEAAPKQPEEPIPQAPTKDPLQWDMSGWGADYGMPQPLTIQR